MKPKRHSFSWTTNAFLQDNDLLYRWVDWSGYRVEEAREIFATGQIIDRPTAAVVLGVSRHHLAIYITKAAKVAKGLTKPTGKEVNVVEPFSSFTHVKNKKPLLLPEGKRKKYVIIDDVFLNTLAIRMQLGYRDMQFYFE